MRPEFAKLEISQGFTVGDVIDIDTLTLAQIRMHERLTAANEKIARFKRQSLKTGSGTDPMAWHLANSEMHAIKLVNQVLQERKSVILNDKRSGRLAERNAAFVETLRIYYKDEYADVLMRLKAEQPELFPA